ncbi:MAG: hypothetical protein K8T90_12195 [Planctomycetes bacterium]|nr:hypothetical protein [Planctomycetota bacterium]
MAKQNVVYVLGAGFSAPLEIPVMSRFMERAREMYEGEPDRFGHFKVVFDKIRSLRAASEYVDFDRFNVEDVLSVIEMEHLTNGSALPGEIRRFISDTIEASTPGVGDATHHGSGPSQQWFIDPWRPYAAFVFGLAGLAFRRHDASPSVWHRVPIESRVQYDVITLNYDMVIETVLNRVGERTGTKGATQGLVRLHKLHGSVHDGTIIPPTWNKRLDGPIAAAWKRAAECLAAAHEIRFLGYSFPRTDVNVRFLLASALQRNDRLSLIHVLCLDPDKTVERRYRESLPFRRLWFRGENVVKLLAVNQQFARFDRVDSDVRADYDVLERSHSHVMG